MKKFITTYKWICLPVVLSSAAVLSTAAFATPSSSKQYQDGQQTSRVNQQYVGGNTQIGTGITDQGNVDIQLNQVLSESNDRSTSAGIWADYDLKGDDKGLQGRGVEVNHNWVSRDDDGQAQRVNKAKAAYDRNSAGHEKVTLGYGQETQDMFWEGRVSKGLSGRKDTRGTGADKISDRAYEYGVGASIGTFLPDSNLRVRGGLDHEWSDKTGNNEKNARNTTLSAGVEKFFDGTGHSVSLDVSGSKRSGGYQDGGSSDNDYSARLGYKYDFAGSNAFQNATSTKRVRVEVPGQATPPRYNTSTQYKKVPTYKTVPVYGKKIVKVPYKSMVKSTMSLEGQTFFKKNSSKLIPSAQQRLSQVANEIRKTGYKGTIRITGNTCGLGNAQYDQILSERRAKSVRNFLIKQGFNADHLMARGLGKMHPKYRNIPGEGFKNRRVDIEYVTETNVAKSAYRSEEKTVQTGTRQVATGFQNVAAGTKNVLIDSGKAGTPRVIWKTETVNNAPAWIKRALYNNIKHDRTINTYQTTEGFDSQPINTDPVATDDSAKTACGIPVSIDVLGNDTDANNNALTILSFTQGANGTVTRGANGQLIYTSTGADCGQDDQFTYTVSDGNGGVDTAKVTVSVDLDEAVSAANETTSVEAGQAITIDVLDNDDSDATINRIVTNPSNGTVEIIDGKVVYRANTGFSGTDTFTYEVVDANGNKDTATVTVNVQDASQAANTAPVAQDDQASTTEGQSVTLDSLANDTDTDDDTLVIDSVSNPTNGTAVVTGGQIIYTPDTDFTGTDTFTYIISDGNGGTSQATETVIVNAPSNQAPIAVNDTGNVVCSGPVVINVLENDTDADTSNNNLNILDFSQPTNGTVTKNADGQLVYTSNGNSCGTNDQFTYNVTDGVNTSNTATVTIAIAPAVNNAPTAADDEATTQVNSPVTIMTVANDTDPDGDNLKITDVSQPQNGTVTISSDGTKIIYTPKQDFTGVDIFDYTITDGNGGTSMATETVTVTAAPNTKPIAKDDNATTEVGTPVTLMTVANDSDPDGDVLTITSITQPANGTATSDGKKITYTPKTDFTGIDKLTYVISDGRGGTATATETITVTAAPNTKPIAKDDSLKTPEGTPVILMTVANDTDADGDDLTITNVQQPQNGSVTNDGKKITYTPKPGFIGMDKFTYTIQDGNGGSATATETVIVEAIPNKAPTANLDTKSTGCAIITIDALANDTDPENDTLTIVNVSGASLGTATIVGNKIQFKPSNTCDKGGTGTDTLSYTISDGVNTSTGNVKVEVKGDIGNTRAESDTVTTEVDKAIQINVLANDSGIGLTITMVDDPINGAVSVKNGVITYTPNPGFEGTDDFYYDIVDQNGYKDAAMIIVKVEKPCPAGQKCN
ncbi:MAG: outer membrane protein OmpA-like peptidoglycan-associated protein [Cocleimonas sp.]|jgi:outer membrane protein OmpA-like peptidoglycan-associated protein